jgi:gas vesicle protein
MNREDILNSIGLQSIPERSDTVLPAMAIFGAGILVGAGLGLLFAPKPGRELRDDLRRNAGDLGENLKHRAGDLGENLKHRAEDLRQRLPDSVGGMIQNVQNKVTGGGDDEESQKQLAGNTGGGTASKRKNEGPGGDTRPGQH